MHLNILCDDFLKFDNIFILNAFVWVLDITLTNLASFGKVMFNLNYICDFPN